MKTRRLWSTPGRKLFDKGGMIHIKGRQQTGKEASECARNNNCASAHVVFPLSLQHHPLLYISSVNSSGQGPGPPPRLAVQAIICHLYQEYQLDECACVLLNTRGDISLKPHCHWFTHPKSSKPSSGPCPPSPLWKLGGCIRKEKNTSWEKRKNCFGFCFFSFPGSPPT